MTAIRKKSGLILAAAAATLFAAGPVALMPAPAMADGVQCLGINACSGQSECATADSACQGQNECAGQGWVTTATGEECVEAGGRVIES